MFCSFLLAFFIPAMTARDRLEWCKNLLEQVVSELEDNSSTSPATPRSTNSAISCSASLSVEPSPSTSTRPRQCPSTKNTDVCSVLIQEDVDIVLSVKLAVAAFETERQQTDYSKNQRGQEILCVWQVLKPYVLQTPRSTKT